MFSYSLGDSSSVSIKELVTLMAEVDLRLPDPLKGRAFFAGYDELADKFLKTGYVILARDNLDSLAGFAVLYAEPEKYSFAFETYIGVRAAYERQGIATRLTNMELELCRHLGMRGIMTNCHPTNEIKRRMNKKNGYREVIDPEEIASYIFLNPKWAGKAFYKREL